MFGISISNLYLSKYKQIEVWKIRVFGTLILPATIFSEVEANPLNMKSPNSRDLKNKESWGLKKVEAEFF